MKVLEHRPYNKTALKHPNQIDIKYDNNHYKMWLIIFV